MGLVVAAIRAVGREALGVEDLPGLTVRTEHPAFVLELVAADEVALVLAGERCAIDALTGTATPRRRCRTARAGSGAARSAPMPIFWLP